MRDPRMQFWKGVDPLLHFYMDSEIEFNVVEFYEKYRCKE